MRRRVSDESLLAGCGGGRHVVVKTIIYIIIIVLGSSNYVGHACLTPDVGWHTIMIPASTGTNVVSAERMHPVMIRISVVPVMNGHPRDQAKVSVHCRWPLIRGNLTLTCVDRGIDNVAVHSRWPLTTGVAQGRYYCILQLCRIRRDIMSILWKLRLIAGT